MSETIIRHPLPARDFTPGECIRCHEPMPLVNRTWECSGCGYSCENVYGGGYRHYADEDGSTWAEYLINEGLPTDEEIDDMPTDLDDVDDYQLMLDSKRRIHTDVGFTIEPSALNPALKDFQRDIVAWALRRGRAAMFEDTGLGKSFQQIVWADEVSRHTGKPVLILAPLMVAAQTVGEGSKFGIAITLCRSQKDVADGVNITNYEMLHHFDVAGFIGVVIDESSILKSLDGATRDKIIESFADTPYRLACTATPAPNDLMELGNHAEFLGIMSRTEMLAMFFTHDGGDTAKWRLKGHAEQRFYSWVCSWAVYIRRPSDLNYDDTGYILPPLNYHHHIVDVEHDVEVSGQLFAIEARGLNDQRSAKKLSRTNRINEIVDRVNAGTEPCIVWCEFNPESEALTKLIHGAVEITGSDSREKKEMVIEWFQGCKCICNEPVFRGKLTTCKTSQMIPNTSKNTILLTETSERPPSQNDTTKPPDTKKSARNTTLNITQKTENESGNKQSYTENELLTNERQIEELTTQQTPRMLSVKSKNGKPIIQEKEWMEECESTELPPTSTTNSLHPKMEDVPSALAQTPEISDLHDSMSIIATQPERSEDCSAQTATWELESSKILQNHLSELLCTCGYKSGRRILVSKISIFGFGLNFQHCRWQEFCGMSNSFESFYQAVRRSWRFGVKGEVDIHITTGSTEGAIIANINRKMADTEKMASSMVEHMKEISMTEITKRATRDTTEYRRDVAVGDNFTSYLGDCVDVWKCLPDNSIGYTIFSPPFNSLYTYSNSDRDMGNCADDAEFESHFRFLLPELYRVTMPGRLMSFHCMNLPSSKTRDGVIGIKDFRGDLIRWCESAGWIYHSEVVIWKDPVTAMQRTKALGLLHKTIRKDSSMSRQGIPDYLVTMRKPGINPVPINHYRDEEELYAATDNHPSDVERSKIFPVQMWQKYASPVWMDINPSKTLQYRAARENNDERHICPLQLQVIERGIELWSAPGDIVSSPFSGIGSEGYVALKMGRKFIGAELKESYWNVGLDNLRQAERESRSGTLFDLLEQEETVLTNIILD